MLKHLLVENYVLIEHLSVEFSDGFNAITGETGAGKSILLGALNLILGTRADSQSLLDTSKKCVVEGLFIDAPKEVSRILEENSLDVDAELILRREIAPGGKSRAFINDTPVTLTLLKTVGDMLVDIHSQHNTLFLNEGLFQLLVIDHFAGNEPIKIDFASSWNEYKALRSQLEALMLEESAQIKERDYIEFQYNELVSANINEGEQENWEHELELANAAADIAQRFSLVTDVLNSDDGVITKLKSVYQTIRPIAGLSTEFEELGSRINSVVIELQDLASTVEHAQEASSFEPDRIELLREKLDQLYRLEHKHHVSSDRDLITIRNDFAARLDSIESLTQRIDETSKQLERVREILKIKGEKLTESRKRALIPFVAEMLGQLPKLGIPHARFEVELIELDQPTSEGYNRVNFLFNANTHGALRPLAQVASGGELSRIMLAVKVMLSERNLTDTHIFDEIDTGVSGETAAMMGAMMAQMASSTQLITITHLPQIAAKAKTHFRVFKRVEEGITKTTMECLKEQERVNEIASMLGGQHITAATLAAAKQLMD